MNPEINEATRVATRVADRLAQQLEAKEPRLLRPDGSEVSYSTDITGQFQVWRQASEGGWPYQLTAFHSRAARRVAWSPDGERLVISADRDGDENDQLFRLSKRT